MTLRIVYFLSLLFVALTLIPSGAHLLELPNKINLSREHYLIVQQNYRGWALTAFFVFPALLFTLWLTILLSKQSSAFLFALIALLCLVGAQILFWTFTFPANQATSNWTVLPENWVQLRNQWEYSHAVGAGLTLIAMMSLFLSVLNRRGRRGRQL